MIASLESAQLSNPGSCACVVISRAHTHGHSYTEALPFILIIRSALHTLDAENLVDNDRLPNEVDWALKTLLLLSHQQVNISEYSHVLNEIFFEPHLAHFVTAQSVGQLLGM